MTTGDADYDRPNHARTVTFCVFRFLPQADDGGEADHEEESSDEESEHDGGDKEEEKKDDEAREVGEDGMDVNYPRSVVLRHQAHVPKDDALYRGHFRLFRGPRCVRARPLLTYVVDVCRPRTPWATSSRTLREFWTCETGQCAQNAGSRWTVTGTGVQIAIISLGGWMLRRRRPRGRAQLALGGGHHRSRPRKSPKTLRRKRSSTVANSASNAVHLSIL